MRILIIANPNVGIDRGKREIVSRIASLVKGRNGTADITYTYRPGMGKQYSSMAKIEGYDAVYAAGGDGTINDIASGLTGSDIPLGIIPLGTGNGLARGLGIPLEPEKFTKVLLDGSTKLIDTGKISSHQFVATAGIGFDARIAHEFNKSYKNLRSIPVYVYLGIKNYFQNRPQDVSLIVDGKEMTRTIFGLTIANTSQYGGGAIIAPQADPASGKLIAVLVPKVNVFSAIPAVKKLFDGSATEIKALEFIEFQTLKIKRKNPGLYHVDGEAYKGTATVNVSVQPSSLNVIVP